MDISKKSYGKLSDGREVHLFTLTNNKGMEVDITNYGGIVTSIRIPDKNNEPGNIVLGFDKLDDYLGDHPYFGAIIGRYGNRIAKGEFELEGKKYFLAQNNGDNHLHGGLKGFDKVLWTAVPAKTEEEVSLKLAYESKDMEEGYPGNVMIEVVYSLNDANELIISYRATTDRATHVNLTNHSYFNLNNCRGDILDHLVMIDADHVTELTEDSIPTGTIMPVEGTCFDFRSAKEVGKDIAQTAPGYDINYVVNDYDGELQKIASVYHEGSGRTLEVLTTEPGLQFYTANYVDDIKGAEGLTYNKHSALCLETQHFPDSPNHSHFPSTILYPGEEYEQVTIYRLKW